MKISELIQELESAKKAYGDIDVMYHPPLASGYSFNLQTNVHGPNFDTPKFGLFMESSGDLFKRYVREVSENIKNF